MQPSILEHNFEKQISYHFLSHLSQMPTTPAYGNSEGTHHFFELSVGAPFKSWKNSFVLQALTLVNMHIQFCIWETVLLYICVRHFWCSGNILVPFEFDLLF